jgi:hypothetical protein
MAFIRNPHSDNPLRGVTTLNDGAVDPTCSFDGRTVFISLGKYVVELSPTELADIVRSVLVGPQRTT